MQTAPPRIGIVDSHLLFAEALVAAIRANGEFAMACVATSADQALSEISRTVPDVALADVALPNLGAFELAQQLNAQQCPTRFIFLTANLSEVMLQRALQAGAHGYVLKTEPLSALLEAVRAALAGQYGFSSEVERKLDFDPQRKKYELHKAHGLADLSPRQLEVFKRLALGASVKEVARDMRLSLKSVDSHKYRIMTKLNIHDRVELTRYAIREGLVNP